MCCVGGICRMEKSSASNTSKQLRMSAQTTVLFRSHAVILYDSSLNGTFSLGTLEQGHAEVCSVLRCHHPCCGHRSSYELLKTQRRFAISAAAAIIKLTVLTLARTTILTCCLTIIATCLCRFRRCLILVGSGSVAELTQ